MFGFGHEGLLRGISKPRAWGAGVLTGIAIAVCGAAQVVADRRETPARQEALLVRRVAELERVSRGLELVRRLTGHPGDFQQIRAILAVLDADIDRTTRNEIEKARSMLEGPQPPTLSSQERQQFQSVMAAALERVHRAHRVEWRKLAELRGAGAPASRRAIWGAVIFG